MNHTDIRRPASCSCGGTDTANPKGLMFRLAEGDLNLIVVEDKQILPMCQYLRNLATQKGISAVEVEDHKLTPMTHQVTVGLKTFSNFKTGQNVG